MKYLRLILLSVAICLSAHGQAIPGGSVGLTVKNTGRDGSTTQWLPPSSTLTLLATQNSSMLGITFGSGLTVANGVVSVTGGGASVWGSISGSILDQTDLQTALSGKVSLTGNYTDPSWLTLTKGKVGLSLVENTAISTWAGSTNLTTLGTVTTGTWQGTPLADAFIASAATWNAKQPAGNYITALTGDVAATGPGSASAVIANSAVTNAKLANVSTSTIKGRSSAGTGVLQDLTAAQVRAILNVEAGADVTDAANVAAAGAVMTTSNYADPSWITSLSKIKVGLGNVANVDTTNAGNITSGVLSPSVMPVAGLTTIGGVQRNVGGVGQFVSGIDALGNLVYSTPTGGGDVTGPASSVAGNFPVFADSSGKVLSASVFSPSSFSAATHGSQHLTGGADPIGAATASNEGLMTAAFATKLNGIEALADVTDATNVAAAGALMTSTLAANVATFLGTPTSANLRVAVPDSSGSGALIFAGGNIGAATATSLNGLTITASTGVLTITNLKTLAVTNTLTLAGTDGSTLNIGAGGTLGTAAFTAASAYSQATHSSRHLTGGADPIGAATASNEGLMTAAFATKLNGIEALADVTDTANVTAAGALMTSSLAANVATFLGTPSSSNLRLAVTDESGSGALLFAGGNIGAATATSLNGLTITASTGALTITNLKTLAVTNTLTLAGTDGSTLNVGTGGTLGTAAYTATTAYSAALHASRHLTGGADPIGAATASNEGLMTAAFATKLNGIEALADVTDTANVAAAGALMTSSLAANVATFLGTPSSSNLRLAVTDESGSGALLFAGGNIGAATATSLNGLTITASTGVLTITNLKTLSATNTLTFSGTDGSTLNVGTGGTLGTAAYTATTAYSAALHASRHLTGGADPIGAATASNEGLMTAAFATKLNGIEALADVTDAANVSAAGALMTSSLAANVATFLGTPSSSNLRLAVTDESGSGALLFAGGNIGAATATSLNGLTITTSTGVLTITNLKTLSVSNTLTLSGTDGSTLNVGAGGTLGTAAFTASSAYQPINARLTDISALAPTKGRLIVGDGTNWVDLGVGTDGHALVADSAQTKGLKWDAVGGGGGLTGFTSSLLTSSPNNTVNASVLTASGGSTNQDVVMATKGTGAFITFRPPDGTTTGGNKRGDYAVDLQGPFRNSAADVASGVNSFIGNGRYNKATNQFAAVLGYNSTASGNTAMAIGYAVTASGFASFAAGNSTIASGAQSFVGGGDYSSATAANSSAFGNRALSDRVGMMALSGGGFSVQGDAQAGWILARRSTTDNTPTTLFLDGSYTRFTVPAGKVISMQIMIEGARSGGADAYRYTRHLTIKNVSGTTTLLDVVTVGTDYESNAATDVTITADDSTDSLDVKVTNISGENWRSVMRADLVELAY